jgi:hypothetical protein
MEQAGTAAPPVLTAPAPRPEAPDPGQPEVGMASAPA